MLHRCLGSDDGSHGGPSHGAKDAAVNQPPGQASDGRHFQDGCDELRVAKALEVLRGVQFQEI